MVEVDEWVVSGPETPVAVAVVEVAPTPSSPPHALEGRPRPLLVVVVALGPPPAEPRVATRLVAVGLERPGQPVGRLAACPVPRVPAAGPAVLEGPRVLLVLPPQSVGLLHLRDDPQGLSTLALPGPIHGLRGYLHGATRV